MTDTRHGLKNSSWSDNPLIVRDWLSWPIDEVVGGEYVIRNKARIKQRQEQISSNCPTEKSIM